MSIARQLALGCYAHRQCFGCSFLRRLKHPRSMCLKRRRALTAKDQQAEVVTGDADLKDLLEVIYIK